MIQSWLRSENTLAFLNLWEQENNPDYREAGYIELLEKKENCLVYFDTKAMDRENKGDRYRFQTRQRRRNICASDDWLRIRVMDIAGIQDAVAEVVIRQRAGEIIWLNAIFSKSKN